MLVKIPFICISGWHELAVKPLPLPSSHSPVSSSNAHSFYLDTDRFCVGDKGEIILDPFEAPPSYALVTPVLTIDGASSYCKSVEAIQKSKGSFHITTLKDSIVYELD